MRNQLKTIAVVVALSIVASCNKLDISPPNIVQDDAVFTSQGGISAYMAQLYSLLPVEDFKYSANQQDGFNHWNYITSLAGLSGEMIHRNIGGQQNAARGYWGNAYTLIRNANYFLEKLPEYSGSFTEAEVNRWLGEAYFLRAYTYFALAKRYGGVPILTFIQNYPEQSLEELQLPRNNEDEVYQLIGADLDKAYELLGEQSETRGRANRYVAAAFKSRVMLHAASIAQYGTLNLDGLIGVAGEKAVGYYVASYEAAKLLEGKYSLYNVNPDKYINFVNLFFDDNSPENIFVKQYQYPESVHSYDALVIPRQMQGADGYSSYNNPTLDFVEMFDGLPKNADGSLQTMVDGQYVRYADRMSLFEHAEPRLRATVIFPGDEFRGEEIDVRRGVYTASSAGGIYDLNNGVVRGVNDAGVPVVTLPDGSTISASGASGHWNSRNSGTLSGFFGRKYLDANKPASQVRLHQSTQAWIDIRYAEVLLNQAEAAFELLNLGASIAGTDLRQEAYGLINEIRDRAGADLLRGQDELTLETIRTERRKELAFENKTWWDLKRWRIAHQEIDNRVYYILNPYYVADEGTYVFERRLDERNSRFTFQPAWYYEAIPGGEINRNPNLKQNPSY